MIKIRIESFLFCKKNENWYEYETATDIEGNNYYKKNDLIVDPAVIGLLESMLKHNYDISGVSND